MTRVLLSHPSPGELACPDPPSQASSPGTVIPAGPRFATPRTARLTYGGEVAKLAQHASGLELRNLRSSPRSRPIPSRTRKARTSRLERHPRSLQFTGRTTMFPTHLGTTPGARRVHLTNDRGYAACARQVTIPVTIEQSDVEPDGPWCSACLKDSVNSAVRQIAEAGA
jgi:hypothetical protein